MKNILLILASILAVETSCSAQQVVGIETECLGITPNTYYKDVNNVLNKYVGTWIYTSGNTSLTVVLQKVTHYHDNTYNTYVDYLIGEYQYIENGVEKVNTLSSLNNSSMTIFDHNIGGNLILYKSALGFVDGPSIFLEIDFVDPERPHINSRCRFDFIDSSPDKINISLKSETSSSPPGAPSGLRVPYGDYTLIKQ